MEFGFLTWKKLTTENFETAKALQGTSNFGKAINHNKSNNDHHQSSSVFRRH